MLEKVESTLDELGLHTMSELLSSQCEQSLATSPHIVYCILYPLYNTLSDAIFTAIFLIIPGNGVYYQDRRIYAQVT